MKIIVLTLMVFLLTASFALGCHEQVHVQDNLGNDMEDMNVLLKSVDCNWGQDMDSTNSAGWTKDWSVIGYCNYEASVPKPPKDYVCSTGTDYNNGDHGKIYLVCESTNEVPEFSTFAALGILGIAGLVINKKRK